MSRAPAPPRLLTRGFLALLVTQACFGYSVASFQMLPMFLDTALHADPSRIGLVASCFGVATVGMTPLMGTLVDRLGRRLCLALGAALMLATSVAFAGVESMGASVYGLRALQGAAFGMAFIAGSTLAVDHAPTERLAQALGLFGLTMLSMNAVGPVVTEELARRFGWPFAFAAAGGGALVCLFLNLLLLREPRAVPHADEPETSLWTVARRPRQLRLAAVVILTAAACGVMFTFHQPFAVERGIPRIGSFFASYAGAAIVVRVVLGRGIDLYGRHRVATGCMLLYTVAVVAMAELGRIGLVPIGLLFGFAHGLLFPALNALVLEGCGQRERGKVMALYIGSFNLGFAVGPLALGFLADSRGYPAVFVVAGAWCTMALLLFLASPESGPFRHTRGA